MEDVIGGQNMTPEFYGQQSLLPANICYPWGYGYVP